MITCMRLTIDIPTINYLTGSAVSLVWLDSHGSYVTIIFIVKIPLNECLLGALL